MINPFSKSVTKLLILCDYSNAHTPFISTWLIICLHWWICIFIYIFAIFKVELMHIFFWFRFSLFNLKKVCSTNLNFLQLQIWDSCQGMCSQLGGFETIKIYLMLHKLSQNIELPSAEWFMQQVSHHYATYEQGTHFR